MADRGGRPLQFMVSNTLFAAIRFVHCSNCNGYSAGGPRRIARNDVNDVSPRCITENTDLIRRHFFEVNHFEHANLRWLRLRPCRFDKPKSDRGNADDCKPKAYQSEIR